MRLLGLAALAIGLAAAAARGAELTVRVDDGGAAIADAVVSLHLAEPLTADALAVMDQRDSNFAPGVLPVQVGTLVSFPNSDTVQHQVYSFSPAKPFELPLYSGTPLEPVRFDRPGVVVVGCNIHDWMIGYIVVLDSPYFGKTDADGRVSLQAPAGRYQLRVWHARQPGAPDPQDIELGAGAAELSLSLALGPPPISREGSDRLRELQERFRRLKRDP